MCGGGQGWVWWELGWAPCQVAGARLTIACAQPLVAVPLPHGMRVVEQLQQAEAEALLPKGGPGGLGGGAEQAVLQRDDRFLAVDGLEGRHLQHRKRGRSGCWVAGGRVLVCVSVCVCVCVCVCARARARVRARLCVAEGEAAKGPTRSPGWRGQAQARAAGSPRTATGWRSTPPAAGRR